MSPLRSLRRRTERRRHPVVIVNLGLDLSDYLDTLLHAEQQMRRVAQQRQRMQADRAWIRRLAARELAAGRQHVRTLTDATYVSLRLTRGPA